MALFDTEPSVNRPPIYLSCSIIGGVILIFLGAINLLPTKPLKPIVGDNPTWYFRLMAITTIMMHIVQAIGAYKVADKYGLDKVGWAQQSALLGIASTFMLVRRVLLQQT